MNASIVGVMKRPASAALAQADAVAKVVSNLFTIIMCLEVVPRAHEHAQLKPYLDIQRGARLALNRVSYCQYPKCHRPSTGPVENSGGAS